MIKKRLRVSPGHALPVLAALAALISAAACIVNFWVTRTQYQTAIMESFNNGGLWDKIGWGLQVGGMVLFALFVLVAARKCLPLMAIPVILFFAGELLPYVPKFGSESIPLFDLAIVGVTMLFAVMIAWVVTDCFRIKEPAIVLGLVAIVGIIVLTVALEEEPFVVSREGFTRRCIAVSEIAKLAGFFLAGVFFTGSLEYVFRTEVAEKAGDAKNDAADKKNAPAADAVKADAGDNAKKSEEKKDTDKKSGDRKDSDKKGDKKAAKSDGNTVNWALLRPGASEGAEKKSAEEVASEEEAPAAAEIAGEAADVVLTPEEENRRIEELTEQEPSFEEEMNLLDEITSAGAAAETAAASEATPNIITEDGVEIVQYTAPVEDETPAEEKTLAQLLAERGLANHKSELFDEPFDETPEKDYSTPYRRTYRDYPEVTEEEAATVGEAAAEAAADVTAAAEETAAAAAETISEAAAEVAGDVFSEAKASAKPVFDWSAAADDVLSETAEDAAVEAAEAEAKAESATEFSAKGKSKDVRKRAAAEKIADDEPVLTVPVTPIPGNRLQKVLKEDVVLDRDQMLMQRNKVSKFALLGMLISLAAAAVGGLTVFKVISLDALKNEQTCMMLLGFGILGFLMAGTRLVYKEYYTKTVVSERKVTREENNWEEYVAHRLEEDEKNIANLASNYMRMTEMYGHLLETTAELTGSIKALGESRNLRLEAAEPVVATADEEPTASAGSAYKAPAFEEHAVTETYEEPAAEAPMFEEASAETASDEAESRAYEEPAYEEPAYEEPSGEAPAVEEAAYEEPAYEEPAAEETYESSSYEGTAYTTPAYEEPVSEEPASTEAFGEAPAEESYTTVEDGPAYEGAAFAEGEPAYYQDEAAYEDGESTRPDPASLMREDELPYATEEETAAGITEEISEETPATEGAEKEDKPIVSSTAESGNAAILASLFSGKWSKNRKSEEPKSEPAEAPAAEEPVAKAEPAAEAEAPRSGNYNEYLISSMFGRKKTVVPEKVEETVEEVTEAAEEVAAEATEAAEDVAAEATEAAEDVAAEATEAVEDVVTEATEAAEDVAAEATETAEDVVTEATEAVETAEDVVTEATEAAEEVVAEATEAAEDVVTETTEAVEDVVTEATDTVEAVEEAAEEIPDYLAGTPDYKAPEYTAPTYSTETPGLPEEKPEYEGPFGNAFVQSSDGGSWSTPQPLFGQFGYGSLASDEDNTYDTGYTAPTFSGAEDTVIPSGFTATAYNEPEPVQTYEEPAAAAFETEAEASETQESEPEEAPVLPTYFGAVEETAPEKEEPAETEEPTENKRPGYRPSIYGVDVMDDENAGDEMPTVNIPPMAQETAPEETAEEPAEQIIIPTFTGVPDYSDNEPVPEDDTAEEMYNGSYQSKYLSSLRNAKNDRRKQYFFDDEDDFTEPDLPMTELDFSEPEVPESAPGEDEPVETTPKKAETSAAAPAEMPSYGGFNFGFGMDDEPAEKAPAEPQPQAPLSEEDERAKLEARRRALQEKIDQIRKKNQMNQFDDLSDLDDEGVFFHK